MVSSAFIGFKNLKLLERAQNKCDLASGFSYLFSKTLTYVRTCLLIVTLMVLCGSNSRRILCPFNQYDKIPFKTFHRLCTIPVSSIEFKIVVRQPTPRLPVLVPLCTLCLFFHRLVSGVFLFDQNKVQTNRPSSPKRRFCSTDRERERLQGCVGSRISPRVHRHYCVRADPDVWRTPRPPHYHTKG